jgi:polyisoprenyl-teichoic acid--peptidoglycan teichoic acid transferase
MAPKREPRRDTANPHPRRSGGLLAVRLLAAGVGVAAGLGLLGLIWPESDQAVQPEELPTAAALAEAPSRAITVLLIGSDADRRGAVRNDAAPAGPANSDALVLIRVDPKGPLQVLSLPVEAAVQLPGDKQPVALGSLYRRGGPALVAGVSADLLELPKGQPDRYLVLPRAALRQLVDDLGQLELSPDRTMRYTDKAQKFSIALEGGLQQLNGRQVEQLLRFRNSPSDEEGRRERQQVAIESVLRQMGQHRQLQQLPDLLRRLQDQVDTNLTQSEALSLLAATLQQSEPIRFHRLALKPALKPGDRLRQVDATAMDQAWPR